MDTTTRIMVAETFVGSNTVCTHVAGTPLTAGQIVAVNAKTQTCISTLAVPNGTELQFFVYDPLRNYKTHPPIKMGKLLRWSRIPYAAGSKATFVITLPTTVNLGDVFQLNVGENSVYERYALTKSFIVECTTGANNAARIAAVIAEFQRLINNTEASQVYTFRVSATTGTTFTITTKGINPDMTKSVQPDIEPLSVFLAFSQTSAGRVEGWGTGSGIVYTPPVRSVGTYDQIVEDYFHYELPNSGVINHKNGFAPNVYNPVLPTSTYDAYVLDYEDPTSHAGLPGKVTNRKQLIIYFNPTNTNFNNYMAALLPLFLA
jgi:hypothetical protein